MVFKADVESQTGHKYWAQILYIQNLLFKEALHSMLLSISHFQSE